MNRYQAMVETLPVPEGQAERVKAAALAAEPGRRRVFRPWSVGKKSLLAAVLAAGLLVTAGAALETAAWDSAFLERFGLASPEVPGAEGVFRDVNAVSVCGDVTLTVRQAIGDKKNLYLLLDYQLPEDTDLEAVAAAEHLPPLYIDTLRGKTVSWEDIRDMSLEEQRETFLGRSSISGQCTDTLGFDPESRILTCMLSANFQEGWGLETLLNPSITLLVWPPELEVDGEDVPLADHAAVVTFRPSFDVETAAGKAAADGITYTAEMSPLSLQVRMKGEDLPDMSKQAVYREVQSSLSLRLRDGSVVSAKDLQRSGGSSSASSSFTHHDGGRLSGRIMLNIVFRELMDPTEAEAVLVGDVEIPLS